MPRRTCPFPATLLLLLAGWPALAVGDQPMTLPPVTSVLQSHVDQGEIAGAVSLVHQEGRIVDLSVVGLADVESGRPVRADDLFWVASMTKPMAAACVLMLADEGKLSIDDPLEKHLPEFASAWVVAEKTDTRITLTPARTALTLRHLLTHTGGLPDVPVPHEGTPLSQLVASTALQPLAFEPGTQWAYSNAGINALGRVVEVVGGRPFEQFLQERLLDPLKMVDTTFYPTDAQAQRLATSYRLDPETRQLVQTQPGFINGPVTSRRRTVMPAGGLFSTAPDMARFYLMLLNGGELDGRRYLEWQTVQEMTRVQTGALVAGFTPGQGFGLGCGVVAAPQGVTEMLSAGTFGHGGAYGTHSWCDPVRRRIYILMVQRSNLSPHGDGSALRKDWQQAAADALRGQ